MQIEDYEYFLFIGGPANGQRIQVMPDQDEVLIPRQPFLGGTATETISTETYRRVGHIAGPGSPSIFYALVGISTEDAIRQYHLAT